MGIRKFRVALARALPEAKLYKNASIPCGALYIDCNGIIHPVVQRISQVKPEEYDLLIEDILAAIKSVVDHYKPRRLVYLAFDGPVPMCKIQEQRERRYLGAIDREKRSYSGDLITPGTNFMIALDEAIRTRVIPDQRYGSEELIYSSHLVPGEGEHKIMDYMRTHKEKIEAYPGGNIIYGNDSDLILLGLALDMKRVYICKDSVRLLDRQGMMVQDGKNHSELSIDSLRDAIPPERANDFIFACSILGNDFLPVSAAVSDIAEALNVIVLHLQEPGSLIIEDNCLSLFQRLAEEESLNSDSTLLSKIYNKYDSARTGESSEWKIFPSRIFDVLSKEKDPAYWNDAFRYHWYTKLLMYGDFDEKSTLIIARACVEYIRGLYWVYKYYTEGQNAVTWLWYYPYHHVPLFSDLAVTVQSVDNGNILGGTELFTDVAPHTREVRFTCLHQLVSVMPLQSIDVVPEELRRFWSAGSPLIHFMPLTILINNELIEVEHQVKAILPKIDYYTVMEALASRSFSSSMLSKYSNTVAIAAPRARRPVPTREVRTEEKKIEGSIRGSEGSQARSLRGGAVLVRGRGSEGFQARSLRGASSTGEHREQLSIPKVDPSKYSREPISTARVTQYRGSSSPVRGRGSEGFQARSPRGGILTRGRGRG